MNGPAHPMPHDPLRRHLLNGQVIPAHPLALTAARTLDEQRQRKLTQYYINAGAGGVAVAVHTTQFALRQHGLLRPVLELASTTVAESRSGSDERTFVLIAGAVGSTREAVAEAAVAADLGYDAVLLSLAGLDHLNDDGLLAHCSAVADVLPLFGFYLQPAVGGRPLGAAFWHRLAELSRLVAVKIAPFNRYHTHTVVRAIVESGRDDVALYTGNDDSIVHDLLTPFPVEVNGAIVHRYMDGGLLGHWAVWTKSAVRLLREARAAREAPVLAARWPRVTAAITDMNSAVFDAANGFAGCIPGIHEVLVQAGLLSGAWTLDPEETLSPGQQAEIQRVMRMYPEWTE
ncbi:MAG TPA: dihydrodipicolinate synthase family protein [Gemmatimonadales bacterium]|nr:dihydrodipicolinate synthase family protein [Gemmatimonadales bacterium]